MSSRMRIRIKSDGPEFWKLRIEDAETGKLLPVTSLRFGGDWKDGVLEAEVTLVIHEVDIETDAHTIEEVVRVGGLVRARA